MKVAVITRHAITNYGSLLQGIATQKVIENLGHSCEIIDYIRHDESYKRHELTLLKRKPNWYNNPVKRILYVILRQPESLYAGRKFEKAQRKYLNLSKRYTSYEELVKEPPVADVYMTGSDQVWGPVENGTYDSSYCLSFVPNDKHKIAYAASFGHTEFTTELKQYYKKWLSSYKNIAVREDKAVSILADIGIESCQVLDPTLLLDGKYWSNYFEPIKDEKYILVYQLGNNEKLNEYAKKVAKLKNLKLVRVSPSLHQINRGGKLVWTPSLGKFLSYIKNAEYMITDSFHGTAFAINFNTPFIEVLPEGTTNSRNISILALTGLSNQILHDYDEVSLANKKVDFSMANTVLKLERQKSIELLKKMIEQ